jgi:hypothetical protein
VPAVRGTGATVNRGEIVKEKTNWLPMIGALSITLPMAACIWVLIWFTCAKNRIQAEQPVEVPATNVITINITLP